MMMDTPNSAELRKLYFDSWHKAKNNQLLSPMETIIVDVISRHPEYHPLFESIESFEAWQHERFQLNSNPFFHMGMHIAIIEQVQIDRPLGVKAVYEKLLKKHGSATIAEHKMMDCLAHCLVASFQDPNVEHKKVYLEALMRLASS